MILTAIFRSQGVDILESKPQRKLRHTDYYNLATLHRMGFKKVDGQWQRRGQAALPEDRREERAAEPDIDFIGEVPGPSEAGPSVPGPSCTQSGPSSSAPPPAAATTSLQDSIGFSDTQIGQLRALLAEHEEKIRLDVRDQLLGVRQRVHALEEKMEKFESSFSNSADILKTELQSICGKLKDIAGDSDAYSRSNAELQGNISTAASTVENLLKEFIVVQKDGMGKILEELKRLLIFGAMR